MKGRLTLVPILLYCFLAACGQKHQDYWTKLPEPESWVSDFDNIFTDDEKQSLDSLIGDFELKTSIELAVVTIPVYATEEGRFDDLTLHIAKTWGVGKKDKNNGVLIGISAGYQRLRIQTGLGIERVLTDELTQNIIDQVIIPLLKGGDYYTAIFRGIQAIISVLGNDSHEGFINLNQISVFEFIELLKINEENKGKTNILTIGSIAPQLWVTEKDIEILINYIHLTEPSRCVVQSISSYLPVGDSATIGGHAMDIIEAFMENGTYPHFLTSCAKTDGNRIERIRNWWNERKENKASIQ